MPDAAAVPTSRSSDLATFTIKLDGEALSPDYHVLSVSISREFNRIPLAKLVLLDGDAAEAEFSASSSNDFVPGRKVDIAVGYHGDEQTLFQGVITAHGIKTRRNKPSLLTIECRDAAFRLTLGRRSALYQDATDSDIAEEILARHGLQADIEATPVSHKEMVQFRTTDWDFLVLRMDANSRLVLVEDGVVSAKPPDFSGEPVLALAFGSSMIEFDAEMDARDQLIGVTSYSWDYAGQARIESEAEEPSSPAQGNLAGADLAGAIESEAEILSHTGQVVSEELQAWADARLLRSRLARIRGRVRCQGFGEIKPGDMIELQGVGDRFNGKAFVSGVHHEIVNDNWQTDVQFGLEARWFHTHPGVDEPSAAGLLAGLPGLQVGIVRQLEGDPDGEHRVLVNVPIINPDDEGIWARVATLDAGKQRGSFYRPEIGDEVVLGFLNGDPRDPVLLGMFHSSANPAPLTAQDANPQKGFFSREDLRILFDDEKKVLTFSTPAGNRIELSEDQTAIAVEDQNGNKITLNSEGVSLESMAAIKIKATTDVSIEGVNLSFKASASCKSEGMAAEVSSSGTTTIKGSLVQIN